MAWKKKIAILIGILISIGTAYQQSNADEEKTKKKSYPSHQYREYNHALRILWTTVYPNKGKTLYCGVTFSTKDRRKRKKIANAEHVFPMSWVTKDLKCGSRKQCQVSSKKFRLIESDLHNIYPAKISINTARSHFRFGEVSGEKRQFGRCDFEVDKKRHIAEPEPKIRGKIARAMLYLQYQYGLNLPSRTKKLMKKWDNKNPPNKEEKRREKIIEREQGRENPFITRYPFKG
ncbi:MAG: endonuclease [Ostreibacterium sp.]